MNRRTVLLVGLAVIVTLAVYARNLANGFTGWDLGAYEQVLRANNPLLMSEHRMADFKGRVVPGYYAPLRSISLMLDKCLVGSRVPSPGVTALVNLAIHCVNEILLFLLLRMLGARQTFCAIAVFVFLLHPVQIAGGIWFAQRKTALGALFCLLSWLSFLSFRRKRSGVMYVSSFRRYSGTRSGICRSRGRRIKTAHCCPQ